MFTKLMRKREGGLGKCWHSWRRGEGGLGKCWQWLTKRRGGVWTVPFLADIICEQPLGCNLCDLWYYRYFDPHVVLVAVLKLAKLYLTFLQSVGTVHSKRLCLLQETTEFFFGWKVGCRIILEFVCFHFFLIYFGCHWRIMKTILGLCLL